MHPFILNKNLPLFCVFIKYLKDLKRICSFYLPYPILENNNFIETLYIDCWVLGFLNFIFTLFVSNYLKENNITLTQG